MRVKIAAAESGKPEFTRFEAAAMHPIITIPKIMILGIV
jgi:hypothetical protein